MIASWSSALSLLLTPAKRLERVSKLTLSTSYFSPQPTPNRLSCLPFYWIGSKIPQDLSIAYSTGHLQSCLFNPLASSDLADLSLLLENFGVSFHNNLTPHPPAFSLTPACHFSTPLPAPTPADVGVSGRPHHKPLLFSSYVLLLSFPGTETSSTIPALIAISILTAPTFMPLLQSPPLTFAAT